MVFLQNKADILSADFEYNINGSGVAVVPDTQAY
jgi:hypothetical protein